MKPTLRMSIPSKNRSGKSHLPWASQRNAGDRSHTRIHQPLQLKCSDSQEERWDYSLLYRLQKAESAYGKERVSHPAHWRHATFTCWIQVLQYFWHKDGYWPVELRETDKAKPAFRVDSLGFYECNRMPFGLCNFPATFQRLMERCMGELNLRDCLIYLDDIIAF